MSFIKKISSLFSDSDISEEAILALDIGTGSVKALIFQIEQVNDKGDLNAVVSGVGRAELKTENLKKDADKIIKFCQMAVKEAENMSGFKSQQVVLGMTGPFIKCCTNSITFSREKPQKTIDLAEVKNIIQKAQRKIFEKIRSKEVIENCISEIETKLIDGRIIDIKIDGYRVIDPVGFSGKELTLNILNTYGSLDYLKLLREIKKSLNAKTFSLVSYPQAILQAVAKSIFKDTNLAEASCLLIDIGAKTTDVSLAHKGFIEGPKTISLGGNSFTKKISNKLRLNEREAEELKIKYSRGQLSSQTKRKITEILNADLQVWRKGIETILSSDFSYLEDLPFLVLFSGGGCVLPGIKKTIENEEWQKRFNFLSKLKVRVIQKSEIEAVEDQTNLIDKPEYIFPLALVNFGLSLTKKESAIDSILKKIIRLMQT